MESERVQVILYIINIEFSGNRDLAVDYRVFKARILFIVFLSLSICISFVAFVPGFEKFIEE
ncbi:hypothetical protein LEP1GSC188_4300 [Leptospira weilii serovar Topaz str. LT2116]|uniref:Uncharacterized protein n=1 Tax=Leptospira weilii serovar Topaz str. LT2116 TaxID=1088540 RepID=M3GDR0_9LEPT|nr:hypothetical protein LEP1GSC188_4300 [Leptospira weilii serovar Topaz str. LT2116]